ncbi:hypothetical protein PQR33_28125 [Paraburkholderia sediminicola]|uniref:hypothetical protein n=1 Tax=Paraburkholderia sediminicola TaxID=458836 RepID=UPI0038BA2BA5
MNAKAADSISRGRQEAMDKRISSHPNTYVVRENRRTGMVTVRTASGTLIATMRRSAAVRDGLLEADTPSNETRRKS